MNFKKYHVSRNLFPLDESKLHVGRIENDGTIDYQVGIITVGTDSVTYEADTTWRGFYTDFIQVNENEKLTISLNRSSDIAWSCCCYEENDNFLGKASAKSTASIKIFTLLTGTKKVRISVTSSNTTYTILKPMLNSGSQPIPYEPYSSEVWHDTPHYVHNTSTDTITTLPTVVYPNATTATVGLKGQAVQSSVPSPTSPSQPQGTGERTANWFDVANLSNVRWAIPCPLLLTAINSLPNGVYTMSISFELTSRNDTTDSSVCGWNILKDNIALSNIRRSWETAQIGEIITVVDTFTINDNNRGAFTALYLYGCGTNSVGMTGSANAENIMLNAGSTALPYEPYGYKIPISSAGQITPVYFGEVETTRRIKKYEFTGQEIITFYDTSATRVGFYFNRGDAVLNGRTIGICSHFKTQITPASSTIDGVTFGANDKNFYFTFSASSVSEYNLTDLQSIKDWLVSEYAAGTPVTVWYVLAEPQTELVNEPLMKIGDYADTVSGITIPTITGKDTVDVLTTLKPSEVSLSYTGWHDVDVKEWDGSDWK